MMNKRMWSEIEDDLGFNDDCMNRNRPYDGQVHTDKGERGKTEIKGITFRDLRDCYIRAYCLAMGAISEKNMIFYNEAVKGVNAILCENDIYKLDGEPDPMAIAQNLSCEIEKLMGIFPNIAAKD